MSAQSTADRDLDDEHLRHCPACGAEWPRWDPRHGENPLIEHLASEESRPRALRAEPGGGRAMSYESQLDRIEQRFVDAVGRQKVDRLDDRIVVDYDGRSVQITGKNRCIVGASRRNRDDIRTMIKEALEPMTDPEDAFPSVGKQQMEGFERCDSCGKLKEAPEALAVLEQEEQQTVAICWECHNAGRSL